MSKKKPHPHIAIFNSHIHGHINPTLSTVKELVARGYRVSYAVSSEFAEKIAYAGAAPIIIEPKMDQETPMTENLADIFDIFAEIALDSYPKMAAAFAKDRPDIVAYDIVSWHGKALAHHWGVPSVLLNPTHVLFKEIYEEWCSRPLEKMPYLRILEKMLRDNGLELDVLPFAAEHKHSIAYIPRSFQKNLDSVDPATVFVGPDIGERAADTGWQPAEAGKPVILVSLGTLFNYQPAFFRTCIEAFADTEWHIVLTIGPYTKIEELGPIAANIEIHRQIPQLEILRRSSLFITHAGMGGTMEAVHFGVPMLAIPQISEQCSNAEQIAALGLGKYLPRENITADRLRSLAGEIIANPAYRQNIARLQQEVKEAGGAKAAADVFDKIAAAAGIR